MDADQRKRIADKIAKCLALSESSNEHEAAMALKQAKALMTKHGIDETEVQAAKIVRERALDGERIPRWKAYMGSVVAKSFDILGYWDSGLRNQKVKSFMFVGDERVVQAADYAFEVLLREAEKAANKAFPPGSARGKKNSFLYGYISAIAEEVERFATPYTQNKEIMSFLQTSKTTLGTTSSSKRMDGDSAQAFRSGAEAGSDCRLRNPVSGVGQGRLAY